MKITEKLNLKKDEGCYNEEYGDCEFFKTNDLGCLECKIMRIKSILETITIEDNLKELKIFKNK